MNLYLRNSLFLVFVHHKNKNRHSEPLYIRMAINLLQFMRNLNVILVQNALPVQLSVQHHQSN